MINEEVIQITNLLERTISNDREELNQVQNYLEHAAQTNLPGFLKTLSNVLLYSVNNPVARIAAGLQIKNHITSKDEAIKIQMKRQWLFFTEQDRIFIKENILKALGTESRPSSAAQCIATVAIIELPLNLWPGLITLLTTNATNPNSTDALREASLETIGYICAETNCDVLKTESNLVLTAIVHGMTQPNSHVCLAATTALYNSLEFAKGNFEKNNERDYIMEVVCKATQSTDIPIRVASLQCLVKIVSLYYENMEMYMTTLFPITLNAIKSELEEEALQGIEFWSSVAEEEAEIIYERQCQEQPNKKLMLYAEGALKFIIPVLMEKLAKQEEGDEDDWNSCKSAGVCIILLSTCCQRNIVPHVIPFINENIINPDWRYRDASIMTLGSILGGLDQTALKSLLEPNIPVLIHMMHDASIAVQDTTAWTFGRIFEFIPHLIITSPYLIDVLGVFVKGLKSEARVATNICWAFSSLAQAIGENMNVLTQYFDYIVQGLLETTERFDGMRSNLRSAAYEALMDMIKYSPADCYETVKTTTIIILTRLNQIINLQTMNEDCIDMQGLLCATLQSVIRKMSGKDVEHIADMVMNALLFMLGTSKDSGLQEDALMTISPLVENLGKGFNKYMEYFKTYLFIGLQTNMEFQVCLAAIGLVGDLSRALHEDLAPHCDQIFALLFETLQNNTVNRNLKPQILSTFGDIALGIGSEFKKYLEHVLNALVQVAQLQMDPNDAEIVNYLNELREGVLAAYVGIVQGLKGEGYTSNQDVYLLEAHLPFMVQYMISICSDPNAHPGILKSCCGLVGDLCTAFGQKACPVLDNGHVHELLYKGRQSADVFARNLAHWSTKELQKIKTLAM
ncbi:Armadillo-type fold,Armadillo-like helical,Importin-beta, N-terminal domain [Cinara cedri]|uniref:Armadillo-type fold,Armadillo-like helical,Importin-beta, N-terminal domain n=1 Tax=Cinara cedri TaxID=506608 RepID=A0A5E4MT65_9HEMI|nr:Armadillo-type fold,Armadillo-like helical,Importin-beta, N-terminal domain [Cinara cedri]